MRPVYIRPIWQVTILVAIIAISVWLLWPEQVPEPEIGTALRCFNTTDGIVCFES